MKIEVELPIRVNVDNIGVIFLAENQNSSDRTKHVDIRIILFANILKMDLADIQKNWFGQRKNTKRKQKLEFYQQEGC